MNFFITEIPPTIQGGLFNCFSKSKEELVYAQNVELVDYFVMSYPRKTSASGTPFSGFAFTYFEGARNAAFTAIQPKTLTLATELFSDAKPLGIFEQQVLNETFMQSLKSVPTRKNRL